MSLQVAESKSVPALRPRQAATPGRGLFSRMTLATRLAIGMIVLVTATVTAVGWLSYRSLEHELLSRVLDRIDTHSKLIAADLQAHVRDARTDVATFGSRTAANGIMTARVN